MTGNEKENLQPKGLPISLAITSAQNGQGNRGSKLLVVAKVKMSVHALARKAAKVDERNPAEKTKNVAWS